MTTKTKWVLLRVLEGLDFPAEKWRILAQADLNGVDTITRERLRTLPEGIYRDIDAVVALIDRTQQP
jgi:hypothetical protein